MPEGFNGGFGGQMPGGANQTPPNNEGNPGFPGNNMQIPGGNFNFNQNSMENTSSINSDWIWIAVSVLILGVGLIIAKEYKY